MEKDLYIGEKKIRAVMVDTKDDTIVNITFKDNTEVALKQKLFDLIKMENKGNGTVTECVNAYVARKFLLELADYGLTVSSLEGVAGAIGNLANNLKEIKIGEKFGVSHTLNIKLSDIVE